MRVYFKVVGSRLPYGANGKTIRRGPKRTVVDFGKLGKCVHQQACGAIFGQEYEHDDPNWQPPPDWPYEVKDLRKPK